MAVRFHCAVIVGVGLIGGSLGQALRRRGVAERVIGIGRSEPNLRDAVRVGAIDEFSHDLAAVAGQADLIVVATPISQMSGVFEILSRHADRNVVITDVGSVKEDVVAAAAALGPRGLLNRFVPSHPIAGTEFSGAAHSFDSLFEDHWALITPHDACDDDAVDKIAAMWRAVGSKIQIMKAREHDRVLAKTSHLPHALAFALVYQLATDAASEKHFQFVAGGFYDFTRIAASDGELWRDICFANKHAIGEALTQYGAIVDAIKVCLDTDDKDALRRIFDTAQAARLQLNDSRKSRRGPENK